ncbi:hypothetical protein J4Q44_G00274620 [Coregonus suidteri]|uniref:Group XIIB secretory phospholipase A2-like protein n=1 Tax=Coregonus suidteri TaxID=861788 RepID=A0AAN8L510_9TELE
MLPRTSAFLMLSLCLSWGMSASLVRNITPEEEVVPAAETMFRDEFVAEEPVADSPVADAPVAAEAPVDAPVMADEAPDMEAIMANMPVLEDPAYMDLESLVKEALITEAMIKELSAQVEEEDLAKETEIQDAILKDLADQEALEKATEPIEEAAEAEAEAPAIPVVPVVEAQEEDSDWGLVSIRESLQAANGYFDSLVELMGGRNGVCQYKCKYGKTPVHRHGYVTPEPNGCSSDLLGFQVPDSFDMGIPAMTQCCNLLDRCYDTCGSNKNRCDSKYRLCLHDICSDLKKSLGLVSKVKACESVADALYNTVWTLGCRSFMNSQREACYCEGEERDEL